jgi:hypothetical protein
MARRTNLPRAGTRQAARASVRTARDGQVVGRIQPRTAAAELPPGPLGARLGGRTSTWRSTIQAPPRFVSTSDPTRGRTKRSAGPIPAPRGCRRVRPGRPDTRTALTPRAGLTPQRRRREGGGVRWPRDCAAAKPPAGVRPAERLGSLRSQAPGEAAPDEAASSTQRMISPRLTRSRSCWSASSRIWRASSSVRRSFT